MKTTFVGFFLLCTLIGFAQKSHIALNMGPSFPIKNFAGINDYSTNGYALPGFNLSFDANYIPTWYFGIGGNLSFNSNGLNQDSMLTGFINKAMVIDEMPYIPEGIEPELTLGQWVSVNLMVGPTFSYPAGMVQFKVNTFIGFSSVIPPSQLLTLYYEDSQLTAYSAKQSPNFCYSFGTDIIFDFDRNYSLKIGAEYFHTKANYSVDILKDFDATIASIPREIEIEAIQATLGLAYLF